MAYKAPVVETRGQFRVWGEGGAIFSGGDPVTRDYTLTDFTSVTAILGGGRPGSFDLTPKVGWEAAAGFDYRFAGSPWHVSGQFRYGEGKNSGFVSSAGAFDPALLALLGAAPGSSGNGSESFGTTYKETHWLADIAVGRDVIGTGASAMQVKFGLRLAEFVGKTSTTNNNSTAFNFGAPFDIFGDGSLFISQFTNSSRSVTDQRSSFLGAGPRAGIEGSVPFAGNWAFDYLGDIAVLFGNQRLVNTSTLISTIDPPILAALGGIGGGNTFNRTTDQRFATVFNADIQIGVSYWMTQNLKLSASYRLDAYFNVLNQTFAASSQTTDRYIHGPRLGVSAQF